MKYTKTIPIFFLFLFFFSCATKQIPTPHVDIDGNPEIIKALAVEIADLINQEKSINTIINLVDVKNALGDEVLAELKKRGFPLSDDDGIKTTFIVRGHDSNKIYLSISLGKMILSRIFIYEAQTGTIIPGSPLSKGEV